MKIALHIFVGCMIGGFVAMLDLAVFPSILILFLLSVVYSFMSAALIDISDS